MWERIKVHVRGNVVGYLALFVALGGTAAWAADKITSKDIARNAVLSRHIKNGQVKSADVQDNGLTGADVSESSLGQVPSAQSASNADHATAADSATTAQSAATAQTAQAVADNAIGSAQVADDSLTGADVNESALSGLVNGKARVLTGFQSVTAADGNPTILAIPGWGDLLAQGCTPGTAGSRRAGEEFASSGPSGTAWIFNWNLAAQTRAGFSTGNIPGFPSGPVGDAGANEALSVLLSRTDSPEVVYLPIGEVTGNTTCDYHVQAVISDP